MTETLARNSSSNPELQSVTVLYSSLNDAIFRKLGTGQQCPSVMSPSERDRLEHPGIRNPSLK